MAILTKAQTSLLRSCLGLAMLMGWCHAAFGQLATRHALHAAFLVNLTQFVTWPVDVLAPEDSVVVGTFDEDPINPELQRAIAAVEGNGRKLRHFRIERMADMDRCHVVFVSRDLEDRLSLIRRVSGKPVLAVSDYPGVLSLGGHVAFVPDGTKTRLRVDLDNLRESKLVARSQLLRLAKVR